MYFLLAGDKRALHRYARNRRGSVALYCALVCALCAARCGACDRRGLARKEYRGWRKGAGSKIAVGPPIPIYTRRTGSRCFGASTSGQQASRTVDEHRQARKEMENQRERERDQRRFTYLLSRFTTWYM